MDAGLRFWSRLALPIAMVAALSGVVHAQEDQERELQQEGAAVPVDRLSPARLFSGPSLYETGRIGGMAPDAPLPTASEPQLVGRKEKDVGPAAASLEAPRKPEQGIVNQRVLEQEVAAHFEGLQGCRVDVARSRQVMPSALTAETLLLRWRIETDGSITTTDVVATAPVDMSVMDCVKAAMSRWNFTRPRGGSVHVERVFAFR